MTCVIVNDASCLIDLHKGQLLHVFVKLPCRIVVPVPIRESELIRFSDQEWRVLDDGGLETFDIPSDRMGDVFALRRRYPRLSANDCFCLVAAQCHDEGILLTGDALLRRAAGDACIEVRGVLWVIDALKQGGICGDELLVAALEAWRSDRSVFLPAGEVDTRLRRLR